MASASLARGLSSDVNSKRVAGLDVLQAKTVVGYAERLGQLARRLDQVFHFFVVHSSPHSFLSLTPNHSPLREGEESGASRVFDDSLRFTGGCVEFEKSLQLISIRLRRSGIF